MFQTVWQYQAIDYENNYKRFWRKIFFYAGSIDYTGSCLGQSGCVWMVPKANNWIC